MSYVRLTLFSELFKALLRKNIEFKDIRDSEIKGQSFSLVAHQFKDEAKLQTPFQFDKIELPYETSEHFINRD